MRVVSSLFVLVLFLAPSLGRAQTPDDEEARSLYEAGRHAFEAGRFDRALEDFQRAYELSQRPTLLFNIGQAADRLRHDQQALDAFEQYLASPAADPALRAQIEGRVTVLRAAIAAATPAPTETTTSVAPPPDPTPAPAPVTTSTDTTPAIALLVTGGVLAAGGIVMIAIGATENASVQNATPGSAWSAQSGNLDAANGLVIGGGVALGLGVVGCVIGGVLLATSGGSTETHVAIGPGSISVGGTF